MPKGQICFLCNSRTSNSYHQFPKKEFFRAQWFKVCRLDAKDKVNSLRICCYHFKDSDFVDLYARHSGGVIRLKPNAIPTRKAYPRSFHPGFTSNLPETVHLPPILEDGSRIVEKIGDSDIALNNSISPTGIAIGSGSQSIEEELPRVPPIHDGGEFETYTIEEIVECNDNNQSVKVNESRNKRMWPRYSGDFILKEDLVSMKRTRTALFLAQETITKQRKKIIALQQRNRRMTKKVRCLEELLCEVKRSLVEKKAVIVCDDEEDE